MSEDPIATQGRRPSTVLCLGEALVDLICERPVEAVGSADAFVPHFGGAVANVAVIAASGGARVALMGGAGDDPWGVWLRDRLAAAGVDVGRFPLHPGVATPLSVVTVDGSGEPSYTTYGAALGTLIAAVGDQIEAAIDEAGALFVSSNTLVGEAERAVTMRAIELAHAHELPVIFDPNLRLGRWRSRADATASANACIHGALLVRSNLAEAQLMTGERDVERAATALLKSGARNVVISLGADGAVLRGKFRADVPGVPAHVISTIGAGDALTGTLLAQYAASGFYEPAIAASLRAAVAAGAAACERWGAVD